MQSTKMLKLVEQDQHAQQKTPAERVFDHWVFMLGKNPRRCALGPLRRKVIERALALYDEETLCLAIEGNAASAWHAGENDRGTPFNDIELILRNESNVERFCEAGERLRLRAQRQRASEARREQAADVPPPDAAQVAQQREALRRMAAALAGRRHD